MGQILSSGTHPSDCDSIIDNISGGELKVNKEKREKKRKAMTRLLEHGVLDISNLKVSRLPKIIASVLEDAISNAKNVNAKQLQIKEISFYSNKFEKLPLRLFLSLHNAGLLKELRTIDFSFNRLEGPLPEEIGTISETIQRLELVGNRITTLPTSLQIASNLVFLDIRENPIDINSFHFADWKSLRTLRMAYCGIKSIPCELLTVSSLTQLDLSNNALTTLESQHYNLPNLIELNLLGNQLTNLPEALFETMSVLRVLCASNNILESLPDSISRCTTLKQLYLDQNCMKVLPQDIDNLINLSSLDLSYNHLKELPTNMSQLTDLQSLELVKNCIVELFDLSRLKDLRELNISSNKLMRLNIRQCTSLTSLYAGYNDIRELELDDTNCLRHLNLSGNHISNLSEDIINSLTQLAVLYISDNGLTSIPSNLHSMPNLKHLNIAQNLITELNGNEKWFTEDLVISLSSLNISMNRIKDLDRYIKLEQLDMQGYSNLEIQLHLNGHHSLDRYVMKNYSVGYSSTKTSECAYAHTIGPFRPSMEDAFVIKNDINVGQMSVEIYAVFDGHAGNNSSNHAASRLADIVKDALQNIKEINKNVATLVVTNAIAQIDEEVKQFTDGSTLAMVMILDGKLCVAANVGDARCVLAKEREGRLEAHRITFDHKPYDRSEANRVYELGGVIVNGRINGYAVSRALGDHIARPFITSEPHIHAFEIDREVDKFFVIACDGVWDVHEDQDTVDIVARVLAKGDENSLFRAADTVVSTAIANRSRDNISAIVVRLS